MRRVISYISFALFLFGIFSFLYILLSLGWYEYKSELPITDIQGIVEKNERIYIGLGFYNRIQVYDMDGSFLYFIKVNNHTKQFDFWCNGQKVGCF